MKKIILAVTVSSILAVNFADGSVAFSDNFNSYVNGNLAGLTQDALGQGTWRQTSTAATTPIQVNNGTVVMGNSGQDVYSPLTTPITLADGASVYFSLDINVSGAASAGDYFLHFTPNAGNSSLFYSRLFVRTNAAGGYQLGWLGTSGGAATPTYGTTVLSLGTTYQVVMAYDFSATTPTNSSGAIYIDPTDPNRANNTAYVSALWTASGTVTADTNSVAAVNLRQGSAANSASLTIDNLLVATAFSDVVVPEPSTMVLASLGGLGLLLALRRRR
jgi:PEP-CTERM motif